jgi:hypothetical protein
MPLVDVTRVAQALNLTESRVHQLVKEGLPRENRGQYDAVKCLLWYIRYLQAVIEKKTINTGNEGFAGEREERVRLLRATLTGGRSSSRKSAASSSHLLTSRPPRPISC